MQQYLLILNLEILYYIETKFSIKRFILGIDRAKMRLYDVEQVAQKDVLDSGQDEPVFDNTGVGKRLGEKSYEKFSDLKI